MTNPACPQERPQRSAHPGRVRAGPDRPPAVPVRQSAQPRADDDREQRHRAGQDGQGLQRADHPDHGAGGPRRQAHQGAAGRLPRSEADRPHLHQHLGRCARRRRGEEDRPQEDHHGGALVGDLPRHAGDPGRGRRLRGLRRHRRIRRRERRSARHGDPPHGRWPASFRSRGWRWRANCSATGRARRRPRRAAEMFLEHGGGTGIALAWELQLLGQKAGVGA